jgi:outer membrane protein assembly factor BamB
MQLTVEDLIHIGVRGYVLALDRRTGQEIWRTTLKGYEFVNLTLDGPDLFATARGEIFCLDRATGQVKWNNPLRGMGYGLICFATPASPQAIFAESHRRAQEQAAASNSTVTHSS